MKILRRLGVLALVIVVIGGAGLGAYWLWMTFNNTTITPEELPTVTPAPNESANDNAPVITVSDNCEAVASASSIAPDADAQRNTTRFRQLLNVRQPPTTEPLQITIPDSVGSNLAFIQFTPDSVRADRIAYVRSVRGVPLRQIEAIHTYLVSLPASVDANNLPASPIVLTVEPDRLAAALQVAPAPSINTTVSTPLNDPRYGEQWGLPVMGIPSAWSALPAEASEIIVAVIDSGICATHPDLVGRTVDGWDFVDFDNDPNDVFGHGCGVSGIIAANNNNSEGIAGIAPNVKIMPLRVLDQFGLGKYSGIATAIIYAADNGAHIMNLSLAGPTESSIVSDAIDYAVERGVTIIAASGNAGDSRVWFPASHPSVIAVGSIDQSLEVSTFTNRDERLDVLAPGRNILTTNHQGSYELMTGTSFAAPHVAGAAALTLALDMQLNIDSGIIFTYPPDSRLRCQ